jgi:hypothetical protein
VFSLTDHNKYNNKKIIIVDIQPSYRIHMNMDMHEFTSWLNHHDYLDVLYLYNGPDMGYEDEYEIKDWLYDYGLDSDRNITFYEKGYGFFRNLMDLKVDDEQIITLGKYMIQNDINDSRDITEDVNGVNSKYINNEDYVMSIPDLVDELKDFLDEGDKPLMIGGGEYQCFKEVELLLKMIDIQCDRESEFIY